LKIFNDSVWSLFFIAWIKTKHQCSNVTIKDCTLSSESELK